MKLRPRQPRGWVLFSEQESYFIIHVCIRVVLKHMFCPAWSIVSACGCRRRSLIFGMLNSVVRSAGDCVRVFAL